MILLGKILTLATIITVECMEQVSMLMWWGKIMVEWIVTMKMGNNSTRVTMGILITTIINHINNLQLPLPNSIKAIKRIPVRTIMAMGTMIIRTTIMTTMVATNRQNLATTNLPPLTILHKLMYLTLTLLRTIHSMKASLAMLELVSLASTENENDNEWS